MNDRTMADKNKDRAAWYAWIGTLLFAGLLVVLLRMLGLHYWVCLLYTPPSPRD